MVAESDASLRRPLNYSVRNAFIGMTRVARWAGKKHASNEAAASITLDVTKANGSFGLTS